MKLPSTATPHPVKAAALSAALSALLVATPLLPAHANSLDTAITDAVDASYPVLKALKPDPGFPSFSSKLVKTILTADATKLGAAADAGLDVFLSLPDSQISATTNAIKAVIESSDKATDCAAVPLPSPALLDEITGSAAYKAVDSAKLSALTSKLKPAFASLPSAYGKACLPDVKSLEKLVLQQASLGPGADAAKVKALGAAGKAAAASIPKQQVLGLVADVGGPGLNGIVKKPKTKVELEERAKFTSALLNLEKEAKKAALEQLDFAFL